MRRLRSSVFVHALTAIHAVGAAACFVMAAGSAVSRDFTNGLAVSGGSEQMIRIFGAQTWLFLLFAGVVLLVPAHASWRLLPWAWHRTLVVYGIGVAGGLWQVSVGFREGWMAVIVNGAVVAVAATQLRKTAPEYFRGFTPALQRELHQPLSMLGTHEEAPPADRRGFILSYL